LLVEVQGVGKKTAAKLIADVPELGACDRKQIAALVGVAPYNRDSGCKSGQRFISGGRPHVRSILYMATLTATRCNPIIREMYRRLLKAGKKKKVAIVTCVRKLLTILNAIICDRSRWNLAFPLDNQHSYSGPMGETRMCIKSFFTSTTPSSYILHRFVMGSTGKMIRREWNWSQLAIHMVVVAEIWASGQYRSTLTHSSSIVISCLREGQSSNRFCQFCSCSIRSLSSCSCCT
jgi:hypothetical protein